MPFLTKKEYLNMYIFKEIFDKLETKEYKIDNTALYDSEIKRIRDLHNSFVYAFEKGEKKGIEKGKKKE